MKTESDGRRAKEAFKAVNCVSESSEVDLLQVIWKSSHGTSLAGAEAPGGSLGVPEAQLIISWLMRIVVCCWSRSK